MCENYARTDPDYEMGLVTEMMVNDFDDERTLDEEEALEGSEDSHNELSNLQKEGDMPLKDLLAMYGYGDHSTENSNSSDQVLIPAESEHQYSDKEENDADDDEAEDEDDETDMINTEPDLKQFYTEMLVKGKDNLSSSSSSAKVMSVHGSTTEARSRRLDDEEEEDEDDEEDRENCETVQSNNSDLTSPGQSFPPCRDIGLDNRIASIGGSNRTNGDNDTGTFEEVDDGLVGSSISGGTSRLLRSVSRAQSEEEEDDCDYSPDEEEWKKTIMVGSDYQALIPEGLCRYDDALPYENEDKILWDPSHISEEETEEFLERAQVPAVKGGSLPTGSHIRDDEQALYLLLQCGYNLEEALRRRRMNVVPSTDTVSLWSEEECHNFESGLRSYGKDFHLIQKNKVRTRSVGELVQFYYLWKKTERHDIFTYKARLEKKKYALHPGITDYMDRFLEEQEGVRDRSSSPNVHCLLYGDSKRQKIPTSTTNTEETKNPTDSWENIQIVDPLVRDLNGPTATVPSLLPPLPPPPPPQQRSSTPVATSPRHSESDEVSSESDSVNPASWPNTESRTCSIDATSTTSTTTNTTTSVILDNSYHNRTDNKSMSPEKMLPHLPP